MLRREDALSLGGPESTLFSVKEGGPMGPRRKEGEFHEKRCARNFTRKDASEEKMRQRVIGNKAICFAKNYTTNARLGNFLV